MNKGQHSDKSAVTQTHIQHAAMHFCSDTFCITASMNVFSICVTLALLWNLTRWYSLDHHMHQQALDVNVLSLLVVFPLTS